MMVWPQIFFPFIWLSIYFVLEPINVWLGNRSLTEGPGAAIGARSWSCGPRFGDRLLWEMWNFFLPPSGSTLSPWGGCCKIFEMPLPGTGATLPFSLSLYAMYHLVAGMFGDRGTNTSKWAGSSRAASGALTPCSDLFVAVQERAAGDPAVDPFTLRAEGRFSTSMLETQPSPSRPSGRSKSPPILPPRNRCQNRCATTRVMSVSPQRLHRTATQ